MAPSRDSKLVRITLFVFFALLIAYALYEGWGMLYGPTIDIPSETLTVYESKVLVKGRAERITELRLNGKTIAVTEDGQFEEPYVLAEGTNHLILEARDARGRETEKTLEILYVAGQAPAQPSAP